MTTVTERRIVREADDSLPHKSALMDLRAKDLYNESDNMKLNGILKGGRLWKCSESSDSGSGIRKPSTTIEEAATSFSLSSAKETDEGESLSTKRSVRFSEESSNKQNLQHNNLKANESSIDQIICTQEKLNTDNGSTSPESTELLLTFKLGNNVLISNSLPPNSAVRQLFSDPKIFSPPPFTHQTEPEESDAEHVQNVKTNNDLVNATKNDTSHQVTVTAETLRQIDEAKRMKQTIKDKSAISSENQSFITVMPSVSLLSSKTEDNSPKTQIRRTIERNTLRRSLLRHNNEPSRCRKNSASSKTQPEDSLVERIRKLTCDLDEEEAEGSQKQDDHKQTNDVATETLPSDTQIDIGYSTMPPRGSPLGEESNDYSEQKTVKFMASPNSEIDYRFTEKTSSPSASTSSSNSSGSTASTYKKITDLFARRINDNKNQLNADSNYNLDNHNQSNQIVASECHICNYGSSGFSQYIPPDLGNKPSSMILPKDFPGISQNTLTVSDEKSAGGHFVGPKCAVSKVSATAEAKKQFLSTLAPFAACVTAGSTGDGENDNEQYHQALAPFSGTFVGERSSVASTVTVGDETEYSLDDIDEALQDDKKGASQPDIVVGTQQQQQSENVDNGNARQADKVENDNVDELALFVEQDAGRIDRIKKRYSLNSSGTPQQSDEDEHDDYGFNRRPSVRGIKPKFGSTTEILQQIQAQGQPPQMIWASRAGSHMTWPYGNPDPPEQNLVDHPRRRGMLQIKGTTTMPVLEEENAYPYKTSETSSDYSLQPESSRKDITRRYISPNQIMYASTGNLYPGPQQIMRIGGGCSDIHMYGTLSNRGVHHIQHIQYPAASNSPPAPGAPGAPRAYAQTYTAVPAVAHGSQEQIITLPLADAAAISGFKQHFPDDPRFASVQSLDRTSGSMFGRKPNAGLVHMRVSPVPGGNTSHYPPSASIRLAAPFNDPSITAIIEPHYSVQYPPGSRENPTASSIIRVGQGQHQTIRVPYPSGTPVQVHLLTRTPVGSTRCESPNRGSGSPVGQPACVAVTQHYTVARSTQTSAVASAASSMYPVPPNARYYPQMSPVCNTNGPVYNHVPPQVNCLKSQVGHTSPLPYQNVPNTSSATGFCSPTRSKYSNERGVPEGAASSSPNFAQDTIYSKSSDTIHSTSCSVVHSPVTSPTTATSTTNSVYYAMNV